MTKNLKAIDSLLSLLVKKRTEVAIDKGVIAVTKEADTEEEGIFRNIIALPLQVHHLHLHLVVLGHHLQAQDRQYLRVMKRKRKKDDDS